MYSVSAQTCIPYDLDHPEDLQIQNLPLLKCSSVYTTALTTLNIRIVSEKLKTYGRWVTNTLQYNSSLYTHHEYAFWPFAFESFR